MQYNAVSWYFWETTTEAFRLAWFATCVRQYNNHRTSTLYIIYRNALTSQSYGRILNDNELNDTLDVGNNINDGLDLVDLRNNKITSVTVYSSLDSKLLKWVLLLIWNLFFDKEMCSISFKFLLYCLAALFLPGLKETHSAATLFCQARCSARTS